MAIRRRCLPGWRPDGAPIAVPFVLGRTSGRGAVRRRRPDGQPLASWQETVQILGRHATSRVRIAHRASDGAGDADVSPADRGRAATTRQLTPPIQLTTKSRQRARTRGCSCRRSSCTTRGRCASDASGAISCVRLEAEIDRARRLFDEQRVGARCTGATRSFSRNSCRRSPTAIPRCSVIAASAIIVAIMTSHRAVGVLLALSALCCSAAASQLAAQRPGATRSDGSPRACRRTRAISGSSRRKTIARARTLATSSRSSTALTRFQDRQLRGGARAVSTVRRSRTRRSPTTPTYYMGLAQLRLGQAADARRTFDEVIDEEAARLRRDRRRPWRRAKPPRPPATCRPRVEVYERIADQKGGGHRRRAVAPRARRARGRRSGESRAGVPSASTTSSR